MFHSSTVSNGTSLTFSQDKGSHISTSTVDGGEESLLDKIESFSVAGCKAVSGSITTFSTSLISWSGSGMLWI